MSEEQKISSIVSGIQPSGRPHIGNYFGAMARHIEMQQDYNRAYFFIAEYHALTSIQNKTALKQHIYDLAVDYLAIGLDPDKVIFYRQKDVPEIFELTWIFNCLTTMSFLERGHAFKDKSAQGISPSVGLFDYPVLQAADILVTGADGVPVGEDQRQHIEYTREIARKFNSTYGETFTEPAELIEDTAATIPGINGQKMSKSYGNDIPLFADNDELEKKVSSIQTDSQPIEAKKDPEEDLVFQYHKLFTPEPQLAEIREGYEQGGLGYGESKKMLLENMQKFITPLRKKRGEIASKPSYVKDVLDEGAKKIRPQANLVLERVRDAVGINL